MKVLDGVVLSESEYANQLLLRALASFQNSPESAIDELAGSEAAKLTDLERQQIALRLYDWANKQAIALGGDAVFNTRVEEFRTKNRS